MYLRCERYLLSVRVFEYVNVTLLHIYLYVRYERDLFIVHVCSNSKINNYLLRIEIKVFFENTEPENVNNT
jgi:hypothetical protein